MSKAIILLSGGLDSYVSLDIASKYYDVELALTFNYGQKVYEEEKTSSEKIAEIYNVKHEIINLPNLSRLKGDDVWVPNRNGLFINIAGVYCDAFRYDVIIFGGNKDEAQAFPDNSLNYVNSANKALSYSTRNKAKIVAPLIEMTKRETIEYGIKNNLDFSLIKSCYEEKRGDIKHCGKCMSCLYIKDVLTELNRIDILEKMGFDLT